MGRYLTSGLVLLALVGGITYWITSASQSAEEKKTRLTEVIGTTEATVVASATCGCCKLYATYLEGEGFDVDLQLKTPTEVQTYKAENGIPAELQSCHTTVIGDYIIEGHIPVEGIEALFSQKPDIKGIALPGMPSSSPGMPGPKLAPFEIEIITNEGEDGGLFIEI